MSLDKALRSLGHDAVLAAAGLFHSIGVGDVLLLLVGAAAKPGYATPRRGCGRVSPYLTSISLVAGSHMPPPSPHANCLATIGTEPIP